MVATSWRAKFFSLGLYSGGFIGRMKKFGDAAIPVDQTQGRASEGAALMRWQCRKRFRVLEEVEICGRA